MLFEEPEFTLATFENAVVWALRGETTLDRIERTRSAHAQLAEEYPGGFAVMTILSQEASLSVPKDALASSTRILREYRGHYCGFCQVIEGSGFRGSTARSVMAEVHHAARPSWPARVFSDVESAARWLGPLMSPGADAVRMGIDLAAAAQRVRVAKP